MKLVREILYHEPRCLLTVEEAAKRLGIAPQTVYNGISKGTKKPFPIKPKRWGAKPVFDSLDVENYIATLPYDEGTLHAGCNEESQGA
jgi:predicted DNA-binding transcriptional regulator AlpA